MFGMLDYRAYKLFWLITLPFRIAARLAFFVIIGIAIFIGHRTGYHVLVQMVIAYVAFEAISWVFSYLWALLIATPIAKAFFWVIDVVPSRGENMEEAKLIANVGPMVWLNKKLMNDIGNWTFDDTQEFAKCLGWRARLAEIKGQILQQYQQQGQPIVVPYGTGKVLVHPTNPCIQQYIP